MYRETIREFSGMIIGYLDHCSNGDVEAVSFSGRKLGKYVKQSDVTTDFYGKILYRGNMAAALLILMK